MRLVSLLLALLALLAMLSGVFLVQGTVSEKYTLLKSPTLVWVKTSADTEYLNYPLYSQELKKKLLKLSDVWYYSYEIEVPAGQQAFLLTQLMTGAKLYANGSQFDYVPHSDEQTKYIWFRPHLSYIPSNLRDPARPTTVRIESGSYFRYLYISPIYVGSIKALNYFSDLLFFISRTAESIIKCNTHPVRCRHGQTLRTTHS